MSRRRRLLVLIPASLAVVASAALFGTGGGDGGSRAQAVPAAATDLGALVEQFSARSSRDVVRRLERQASARPDDADVLALLGVGYQQLFRESGDPSWLSRSQVALRRSIATGRRTAVAVTGLAQLAVSQHRFREAIPLAREALRVSPDDTAALGALADALVNTGRYHEANRVIDRMTEAGPSVAAYARVAFARRTLGRPLQALDAMELALEAGSGIPEQEAWARVQYGGMLLTLGRVDGAASAFAQAAALVPGYVHARAGMARVFAARGDFTRAAATFERVVEQLPTPVYAIELGDSLARAGRRADARRAYGLVAAIERLLAANGVRTELQTALFDLDHGRRTEAALRRARAAFAAAPSIQAADTVAWGLARTGRCAEARTWSRRALRFGTRDGLFLFHRGMIERCLGSSDAPSWFRRALEADPSFSIRFQPVAARGAS